MQSRMDKYNANEPGNRSRTHKNRMLYEEVRNSAITDFDVNSNVSVIGTSGNSIDIDKLETILDKRYNDDAPKRRSIDIPSDDFYDVEEQMVATKEYDINAIIAKAKQGKNVDYSKERLKRVRDAQYEILNNLDLELKRVEEARNQDKKKEEEENLMNLINTITHLEQVNKAKTGTIDLLDLTDNDVVNDDKTLPKIETIEKNIEDNADGNYTKTVVTLEDEMKEIEKTKSIEEKEEKLPEVKEVEPKEMTKEKRINETLSKLDIKMSAYDDFSDVSKEDKGTIVIKIIIFLIIIALVFGATYILNDILNLGLFNK